jgi:hypothetical protein
MKLSTAATLGRISNLPTVWSNVLAGVVLAGAVDRAGTASTVGLLVVIASLLYTAGMFLNDAFDAEIDAKERPERPIPAGTVRRSEVAAWGLAMLGTAVILAGALGPRALAAAVGTAATIVAYDLHHKQVRIAPLIMGMCRVGLYLLAAFSVVDRPPAMVWLGALVLLGYVLGLTFVAAHENRATVVRVAPLIGIARTADDRAAAAARTPAGRGPAGRLRAVDAAIAAARPRRDAAAHPQRGGLADRRHRARRRGADRPAGSPVAGAPRRPRVRRDAAAAAADLRDLSPPRASSPTRPRARRAA